MPLSVIDSTHIDAGKNLGSAFDEQCYNAGLFDNYAGCGGDDPAYIIRTYHATTQAWRNTLQGVIDAHSESDPTIERNYDQAEEDYLRGFFDSWKDDATLLLTPLRKEALERAIVKFDAT